MYLSKHRSMGQGMTEYIIIVALIAIAAIGIFTIFGNVVKDHVSNMATEMTGVDGTDVTADTATEDHTLKDYSTKK